MKSLYRYSQALRFVAVFIIIFIFYWLGSIFKGLSFGGGGIFNYIYLLERFPFNAGKGLKIDIQVLVINIAIISIFITILWPKPKKNERTDLID